MTGISLSGRLLMSEVVCSKCGEVEAEVVCRGCLDSIEEYAESLHHDVDEAKSACEKCSDMTCSSCGTGLDAEYKPNVYYCPDCVPDEEYNRDSDYVEASEDTEYVVKDYEDDDDDDCEDCSELEAEIVELKEQVDELDAYNAELFAVNSFLLEEVLNTDYDEADPRYLRVLIDKGARDGTLFEHYETADGDDERNPMQVAYDAGFAAGLKKQEV
jgi:predicted RNA-binding Zn-ribbon protein involved in translation (DUF1610 family)